LKKKGTRLFVALVAECQHPLFVHGARAVAALAAHNHPTYAVEIELPKIL